MILLFLLFGATGLALYAGACAGVVVIGLVVRFWWVVALGGFVAALAARVPA